MKDYKPGLKIDKGMKNDCHWQSLVMSNPGSKESSVHSVDVASKVEFQRLGQELSIAENSLAVVPTHVSEVVVQNENVVKELSKVKEERGNEGIKRLPMAEKETA